MSRVRVSRGVVLAGCLLLAFVGYSGCSACSDTAGREEEARLAEVELRCAAAQAQVDSNAARFGFAAGLVEEQHAKVEEWCAKLRAGEDLLASPPLVGSVDGVSGARGTGGGKTWD